jgi:hypothetical protein
METKAYTTIDRIAAGWPSGEWDEEPDKMQWEDPATLLPCLAVRHPRSGHWCGYVGVPVAHPFFELPYGHEKVGDSVGHYLTFSDRCNPNATEDRGICHIPSDGESDNVWWFGFDYSHLGDLTPLEAGDRRYGAYGAHYATLDQVKRQCAELASKLAEARS